MPNTSVGRSNWLPTVKDQKSQMSWKGYLKKKKEIVFLIFGLYFSRSFLKMFLFDAGFRLDPDKPTSSLN